jgi:hypothetical protein
MAPFVVVIIAQFIVVSQIVAWNSRRAWKPPLFHLVVSQAFVAVFRARGADGTFAGASRLSFSTCSAAIQVFPSGTRSTTFWRLRWTQWTYAALILLLLDGGCP